MAAATANSSSPAETTPRCSGATRSSSTAIVEVHVAPARSSTPWAPPSRRAASSSRPSRCARLATGRGAHPPRSPRPVAHEPPRVPRWRARTARLSHRRTRRGVQGEVRGPLRRRPSRSRSRPGCPGEVSPRPPVARRRPSGSAPRLFACTTLRSSSDRTASMSSRSMRPSVRLASPPAARQSPRTEASAGIARPAWRSRQRSSWSAMSGMASEARASARGSAAQ